MGRGLFVTSNKVVLFAVDKFEIELPLNHRMLHTKLRELFMQNKDVKDIRNIDLLVIRVCLKFFVLC